MVGFRQWSFVGDDSETLRIVVGVVDAGRS